MQLDKTQIAIRERGLLEIYDLALLVTKCHWKRILLSLAIFGVPVSLINYCLLYSLQIEVGVWDVSAQFFTLTVVLIYLEAPLVTVPLTMFLGDALFHDKPDWRRAFLGFWPLTPRVFWSILMLRGVLPYFSMLEDGQAAVFFLVLLCLYAVVIRVVRPYISEIVLLERNPLSSKNNSTITIGRRSSALHSPNFGDMVVRGMASSVSILIVLAVVLNIWAARGYLFGAWGIDLWYLNLLLPLGMWLVVAFMSVVRFLSYLDLRIRREGWEVELVVRAEANRWKGVLS